MSKIHDSSISLSLVIFFSFFTVLLLESLKDQWKSGGKMFKLSKLRPYTSERLEIIELFENWNGMLPKIIKSRKNNSTPFRRFLRLDSGGHDFHGHEMVTRHQHRVTSKLGWHTWVGTYAAERLWCLQCRPLSVALQGRLIVSTSNKTMEDRIT